MPAGDLGVGEVDRAAATRQPVQRPRAGMGRHHGGAPEREPGVAVGDRAGDPESADDHLPDEVVDEVLAERAPAQGDDEEHRTPDLDEQVAGDEQPGALVEGVGDRGRHEQAGEHQPDQEQPHRQPVRVEPVRPPRDHVPRVDDRERHDRRLGGGPQVDVLDEVVRELPDREDVDEVEEQLERGDDALLARRPRDGNPHRRHPLTRKLYDSRR